MLLDKKRYIAVEFTVTLIRCLRKNLLEPDEPLVIQSCEQIQQYYIDGNIDKSLFKEIKSILSDLKVAFRFRM